MISMRYPALLSLLVLVSGIRAQEAVPPSPGLETVIQTGHYAPVNAVACSPDGRFVLTASSDKTIKLWEVATGREVRTFQGSAPAVFYVLFSRNGRHFASVARDYTLRVWEVSTGREMLRIGVENDHILCADFSPDDKNILTGTEKNHAILWDLEGARRIRTYTPEPQDIYSQKNFTYPGASSVRYSPDGKYILVGSNDRTAILSDSSGGTEILAQRGGLEEKALAQLSRSSGVHVLAAAGTVQYASEFGNLGHGLFTFAILKALSGEADGAPADGKVTIYELKSYLDDQVPELSRKLKGQPQYPYTFSVGHDFPVLLHEKKQ